MAENTALVKAMVTPEIRDGMERLARMNERSLSAEVRRALREHVARSSLASGAGGSVSAGLAVSSAPVASDEPEPGDLRALDPAALPGVGRGRPGEGGGVGDGPRPGSGSRSTVAELAASFPGVTTGGELDLAKKQVTPHLKQGQAKGGKR